MNPELKWRYNFLNIFFAVAGLVIIFQTVRLQFIPEADILMDENQDYTGIWAEVYPPRGQIYDRHGQLIAGNHTVYELGLDYHQIEDPHAIAVALNGVLGLDYNEIFELASVPLAADNQYRMIAPAVRSEKVAILEDYIADQKEAEAEGQTHLPSLDGLVFQPYLQRSYPEKDLAANVLGFVSSEGIGYFGVEQYYQNILAGSAKKVWYPNNPNLVGDLPEIPPGANLVLTIDREIQNMVEEALIQAVDEYDAKAGTAIIMDPKTGEILALASTPTIDLNQYWRYAEIYPDASTPFNRAISKSFEPGSVFKIFTMAAALDSETVKPSTEFLDEGAFKIGGITIRNWDLAAWGKQDMTGCLQHSLNVCLAWIGEEMGAEKFYSYMDAFGFGHFTGVDMAGEATGRLKAPGDDDWWPADLGTNTFGQGISVTPIQIMMAASSIANQGQMSVPHILHSFVDNGNQYYTHPQIAGQPISKKTARQLSEMLATSIEKEASAAMVDGYRIAGKTGTAEIPTPDGYVRSITNASFIGWVPVDDPHFIVYVWLEEPTPIWGSLTAAPLFSKIVDQLVVLTDLPPDHIRDKITTQ